MRIHINVLSQRLGSTRALLCVLCFAVLTPSATFAAKTVAITNATIETATKKGVMQNATILVKDGKIAAIGEDVDIPVSAQVIDASGKFIMPGIVDPYYVVTIGRNVTSTPARTIVFNGRVFTIGGGSRVIATTFAKISDGLDPKKVNWSPALRSGVTTFHVVTGGYAQSLYATPDPDSGIQLKSSGGRLLVAVSNDTKTLDVLRKNLKPSTSSRSSSSRTSSTTSSPTAALWKDVREGKVPVFINVNNASAILHVDAIMNEHPKAKVALIASGPNVFDTLKSLDNDQYTVILPPAIDRKPNSAYRINVSKMLAEKDVNFALSLSLAQSDFSSQQSTPLFGTAMLIRAGLDRQAAVRALTIEPAKLIGLDKEVGSLEVGKQANLLVFGEDPFSTMASIEDIYVSGERVND